MRVDILETPDLGDRSYVVSDAQRQLVRIGIDRLAGSATGELDGLAPGVPTRSYQQATFADMTAEARVLDVRRDDEVTGGHLQGWVVHVDDDFDNAEKAGLQVISP